MKETPPVMPLIETGVEFARTPFRYQLIVPVVPAPVGVKTESTVTVVPTVPPVSALTLAQSAYRQPCQCLRRCQSIAASVHGIAVENQADWIVVRDGLHRGIVAVAVVEEKCHFQSVCTGCRRKLHRQLKVIGKADYRNEGSVRLSMV